MGAKGSTDHGALFEMKRTFPNFKKCYQNRIREIYDRREAQQEKALSALDQPLQNSKDNIAKIEQKIRNAENQITTNQRSAIQPSFGRAPDSSNLS